MVPKEVMRTKDGKIKGNVDVDLTVKVWREEHHFNQAVIATSDGDFASLVRYLQEKNKLLRVVSPAPKGCSILLRRVAGNQIDFLNELRHRLEYIKK